MKRINEIERDLLLDFIYYFLWCHFYFYDKFFSESLLPALALLFDKIRTCYKIFSIIMGDVSSYIFDFIFFKKLIV